MHPKLCKVGTKKMQHTRFYAVKNEFLLMYALKGQSQTMLYQTIKTIEICCNVLPQARYLYRVEEKIINITCKNKKIITTILKLRTMLYK